MARKTKKRKSARSRSIALKRKSFELSLVPKKAYPLRLLVMLFIMVILFLALFFSQAQYGFKAGKAAGVVVVGEISPERWESCATLIPHIKTYYADYTEKIAAGVFSRDFKQNEEDQLFHLDVAGVLVNNLPCNEILFSVDSSGKVIRLTPDEKDFFVSEVCGSGAFGFLKSNVDSYVQCAGDERVCGDVVLSSGLRKAIGNYGKVLHDGLNRFDSEGYCNGFGR